MQIIKVIYNIKKFKKLIYTEVIYIIYSLFYHIYTLPWRVYIANYTILSYIPQILYTYMSTPCLKHCIHDAHTTLTYMYICICMYNGTFNALQRVSNSSKLQICLYQTRVQHIHIYIHISFACCSKQDSYNNRLIVITAYVAYLLLQCNGSSSSLFTSPSCCGR